MTTSECTEIVHIIRERRKNNFKRALSIEMVCRNASVCKDNNYRANHKSETIERRTVDT